MAHKGEEHFEVEAKIAVDDLPAIEARLESIGAECTGRWRETDHFFDFPDRRLKDADSALRVRQRVDPTGAKCECLVTFKGPRQPSHFKTRQEIEFGVGDVPSAKALFQAIGLQEFVCYTKHRTQYRLADCTIELDQLDDIGTFVEVEGSDESAIDAVLARLGLDRSETITRSYLAMVLEHRRRP